MKRSPLKRKTPLKAKATLEPKPKPHLTKEGNVKRGWTKSGKRSKKSLTNTADKYAREACHARGFCEVAHIPKLSPPSTTKGACGGGLQWCHIVGRKHKKLRWDPLNCLAMCAQCHAYYTDRSAEFGIVVETLYPGRLEELARIDRETKRIDAEYWIAFYKARKAA